MNSLLKSGGANTNNLPETDVFISKSKEAIDKLELSTKRSMIDRIQEKTVITPALHKERENLNFIDKVELSTKKKPDKIMKDTGKPATIISEDKINALLGTIQSETYNARFKINARNAIKSQLLDIVV